MKAWFTKRNYTLKYNDVEPVGRQTRCYAVAHPLNGGATLAFKNKRALESYIKDREHYEMYIA